MTSYIKNVTVLNNGQIVKNSNIAIEDGDLFSETSYECIEYDPIKNCTKYKIIESDSTESYIKIKIDYYK